MTASEPEFVRDIVAVAVVLGWVAVAVVLLSAVVNSYHDPSYPGSFPAAVAAAAFWIGLPILLYIVEEVE